MRNVQLKRYWLVEGRDGTSRFFARAYPLYWYSEQQMGALLQSLASKSSLSFDEIANALCRKGKRTSHLEVALHQNGLPPFTLSCGPMMEWTARVFLENDGRLDGLKV